ncbi:MAG: agmatine deiminase family protein [Bacteroidales bacterium]|jgi:agmatine/peptidylarginine deiminase|nr:agmatine deiminase family protein [Bacteroidales bacterium]
MKNTIAICLAFFIIALTNNSFSQEKVSKEKINTLKKATLEEMKTAPSNAYNEYYKNVHSRVPKKIDRTPINKKQKVSPTKEDSKKNIQKAALEVPNDMIYPGEFDEVQAILMTWPYITRTVADNSYAEQLFDGQGFSYYSSSYVLEPVYSTPDVSNSETTRLFRKLADGIQKNTTVWINIWAWEDSTAIKQHMETYGTPLTNYRFFENPGNSFWYRDCGPVAFYFGEEDSIGFMDFEYYRGRPLDDLIGKNIGEQAGYPVFTNTIEYEGGNILVDGLGSLFTSSAVYELNQDNYGLYYLDPNDPYGWNYEIKTPLTKTQVVDSLVHLMNLSRCIILPKLLYDGGTGHIDLYTDMVDECTFVSTKHPDAMANLSDAIKVEQNMDSITSLYASAPFALKYYNTRIPLPAKDNGSWYSSQIEYNNQYTRSFSNHTFVNNAIMQPVFYNASSGDVQGNEEALEKMKQAYSGYEFVEIDVRDFDGYGGAIHCITKQIPAENPIRLYHYPIRWLNTLENNQTNIWLTTLAQNKSGIASVELFFRKKGEENWEQLNMAPYDGNIYEVLLPIDPSKERDTIEYYISATSNNGKTITKPFPAPKGFYTFIYGTQVEGNSDYIGLDRKEDITSLSLKDFYPLPAKDITTIEMTKAAKTNIPFKVINLKGQVLISGEINKGESLLQLNVSNLNSGSYWVIFGDNTNVTIKKIIVVK